MVKRDSPPLMRLFSTCFVATLLLILPATVMSQGRIPKAKDGSVKGALAFFPNSKLAQGFHTATSTFPGQTDPVLERNNWVYSDDRRVAVKGFVKDAVLLFQWWTLLGDPVEKYGFKWLTSGYYEVMYEEKGQMVTKAIYRSDLAKYPDLLKKFDRIEPLNVDVEITFSSANIDDQKYYDFRRKYNILSDLGSAGYKASYTIKSLGIHYLYAPSGEDAPFIIPTMAVGGWPDFLNVDKKDEERTKRNIELFRLGQDLVIHSFRITDLEWQFSPFIEIAKQFERYEKKEDSPKEQAEKAALAEESTGGDSFWDRAEVVQADMEVYRDPTNYKYGLKAKKGLRALPATYRNLVASANKKTVFFGETEQGVVAINSSGKVLATLPGNGWSATSTGARRYVRAPKVDCVDYQPNYSEEYLFENGTFATLKKTYTITRQLYLTVSSANERPLTESEKRAAEENEKRLARECYEDCKRQAESDGYQPASTSN